MHALKERDIAALADFAIETIRSSGEEARAFYGKGKRTMGFDEGLVTEAELRLMEAFGKELKSRFPEHLLYQDLERDAEYTHEEKRYVWIYDPIDGVANFQAGIPLWGSSVAVLENFWPVFGVFYMPVTGDLFYAQAGGNAYLGDQKIHVLEDDDIDDESVLFTYSRFHRDYRTHFPGKIRNLGSTAAHICYVARGRAEAALINNESYRGLAAARVIIESAGGRIYDTDGQEIFLNSYLEGERIRDRLLVCAPGFCRQVMDFLEPV